jgi:transposase InsO family protein
MPWKVDAVSDIRLSFVQLVASKMISIAAASRQFGISRKTAYKWLKRHRLNPQASLEDRSRRPHRSPHKTSVPIEYAALTVRDQQGWGPRKIRAVLATHHDTLPSIRTFANILRRNDRIVVAKREPAPIQFFERSVPNELWQCDFKGPLEVERRRISSFTVLDDHSRFLLELKGCTDQRMVTAWDLLWNAFDVYGLPDAILCDNAFGSTVPHIPSLSWFESQLIRLGIRPIHGRPYHPQTQGKIERLHGTLERELWPKIQRDTLAHFNADCRHWRLNVYNTLRPHEALGDKSPVSRWQPSQRRRPSTLPPVEYPDHALLRKVSTVGEIRWKKYRILLGRGLIGQYVRVEEHEHEIVVFYAWKMVRSIAKKMLVPDTML